MATTYLPGAVRPANPTRRAFIGAASLTIPVAAMASLPIVSGPGREWDRLVAEFHAANAKMEAAGAAHNAAEEAAAAERSLLGERPEHPRAVYPRSVKDMTVGELGDLKVPPGQLAEYKAALAAWQAKTDEVEERVIGDLEDRWETAVSEQEVAVQAIFAHPAPDTAALLFKLDLAEREYNGFDLDAVVGKHLFADLRRFAVGGA